MDEYSVVFARSARKELERLGEPLVSRVLRRIEALHSHRDPMDVENFREHLNV